MATTPDPKFITPPTASDHKQDHQSQVPRGPPDRPSPYADLPPATAAPSVEDAGEGAAVGPEGTGEGSEVKEGEQREEDGEEEGECGFCLFMKGGGCKEAFVAWEQCVEDAERSGEDVVEKCFEVTSVLKKCMEAHADYYEPILQAERAMSDAIASDSSSSSTPSEAPAEASRDKEAEAQTKSEEKDS